MTGAEITLVSFVLIFGFFMAWNIGANDVANAMGTSVGSRALTLKQAVIIAALFEFFGAFLVGAKVSDTVRSKIFDPAKLTEVYSAAQFPENYASTVLACGMIASLLAAGAWLMFASYYGFPVSTTHSIVGAVVGFGCVALGPALVDWGSVGTITGGWIISPLLSGAVSYVVFRVILQLVFYKKRPVEAAKRVTPFLVFFVLVVLIGVVAIKGLSPFWKERGINVMSPQSLITLTIVSTIIGMIGMFITRGLVRGIKMAPGDGKSVPVETDPTTVITPDVSRALTKAAVYLRRVRDRSDGDLSDQARKLLTDIEGLHKTVREVASFGTDSRELQTVEKIFVYLQILTACFVAFSHGSNDCANAIGPLSAAYSAVVDGAIAAKSSTPLWGLALGGIGIVVGLATWGWRVIRTVGERITELTPSRGFCAEFSAALVILIASVTGLPVSTTHVLVGAVLGVGLARGLGALNLSMMRDIVASWIITIPAGAILAILFYYVLKLIFIDSGWALASSVT
jgi:phosphate/sulfate permease